MKAITGQYECEHNSGVGLDYFTSRIDRLALHTDGRFVLTVQKKSRAVNAAQSFLKGEQASAQAPEIRHEGRYTQQDKELSLHFDNGGFESARLAWNGEGVQIGPNFFKKVSDSTLLPSTHRVKQNMEDIAKGVKIASTLGSMAAKAAKTFRETVQSEPTTPAPKATGSGFCEQCGAPKRSGKRFCHQCGARLD